MLIGYNNDVEYRGKKFHIQTEDHGKSLGKIESQVFHQGQILDTEYVSYDEIVENHDGSEAALNKRLQSLLLATHKGLYKRLISGKYDDMVGLEPLDDPEEIEKPPPEEFEPGQDRVPAAARQVEEEGEEAFEQFHQNQAQKHVDLDDLKSHLSGVDDDEEEAEEQHEQEVEPDSKLDQALADVGETLDEPSDDGVESGLGAADEDEESGFVESRPAPAPESLSRPGEALNNSSSASAGAETSQLPSPSSVSDASQRTTQRTAAAGAPNPGSKPLVRVPETGSKSWKGCETVDGMFSIVPMVEEFLAE